MLGFFAIGGASIGATARFAVVPVSSTLSTSEARVISIITATATSVRLSEARVFAVYTIPAADERVSQMRGIAAVKVSSPVEISEVRTLAVVKGRVADPRVRAWTFTLDGHDFYVLRLGDAATLIYDMATKQWTQWDTPAHGAWRPLIGTTWIGAHKLANEFGTNIVAGDDEFGLLWFLDPMQSYDDGVFGGFEAFTRVVTGQYLASGRQQIPCYAVFLDGDNYGITADYFQPYVRLDTSDDQGRTFDRHDTLTIAGDNDQPDTWYSLGQFGSPGRIFRLTDNGLFARIDSMEMNDDAG